MLTIDYLQRKELSNMKKVIYSPGICVHCGSDRILYDDPILEDNLIYKYTCEKCHKKGEEVYDILFSHNKPQEVGE